MATSKKEVLIFSHFKNNKITLAYRKELNIPSDNKLLHTGFRGKDLLSLLIKLNALISAVLVIVTIIMSTFIVKPVNKLIKSTRLIAGGNFSERVKVKSNDEIGLLAENFNLMAVDVEDKVNQLKKASDDKQRFIDNLVHELRTPLTSIIVAIVSLKKQLGGLFFFELLYFEGYIRIKHLQTLQPYCNIPARCYLFRQIPAADYPGKSIGYTLHCLDYCLLK